MIALIALRHSHRQMNAGSVLLLAAALVFLAAGVSLAVTESPAWLVPSRLRATGRAHPTRPPR